MLTLPVCLEVTWIQTISLGRLYRSVYLPVAKDSVWLNMGHFAGYLMCLPVDSTELDYLQCCYRLREGKIGDPLGFDFSTQTSLQSCTSHKQVCLVV